MFFARVSGALVLACAAIAAADLALADGLTAAGPRRLIADDAGASSGPYELPATPFSATPVPLRLNTFVIPFTTTTVSEGGIRSGIARYQAMAGNFTAQGGPRDLISGLEGCCTGWSENGGTRFGSFTQLVLPLLTFNGEDNREVMGFAVRPGGAPGDPEATQWLTRHKPGNQGGAVVVPLANGNSFVMWTDVAPVAGGSQASVRGVFVNSSGAPTGNDIVVEGNNTGRQVAVDGAQLANGRIFVIWTESSDSDITGRTLFYGRFISPAGNLVGPRFLLGANNDGSYLTGMRVAALPNGNFVVTWIDDRIGASIPLFRIFTPEGLPLFFNQPFATYTTPGLGVNVAALADSRFVITGAVTDEAGATALKAQLFSPVGAPIGAPLTLQVMNMPDAVAEQHIVNAGYLLSTPPPAGGLKTASDPNRVFVTWRLNRPANLYDLYGQLLTAAP